MLHMALKLPVYSELVTGLSPLKYQAVQYIKMGIHENVSSILTNLKCSRFKSVQELRYVKHFLLYTLLFEFYIASISYYSQFFSESPSGVSINGYV